MRLSIRLWTILALNAFVIGLSAVLGWVAQDVSGQAVDTSGQVAEERFVRHMVAGVSRFLQDRQLPPSNAMMANLHDMFQADWVAAEGGAANQPASSMPPAMTAEFKKGIGVNKAGVVQLGSEKYRVDSSEFDAMDNRTGSPTKVRLYMIVPYVEFQEARRRASGRILDVVLPAAGVATVLAVILALGISRPIRRLAREMDRLADSEGGDAGGLPEPQRLKFHGPKEISQLACSFYALLDRLSAARASLAQSERLATLGKVCLSVAHELRNPLSGIKMNVRVLKDGAKPGDAPGIEAILREIDRMGLYLNELMNLAPGNGAASRPLELEPVKLSELARSVLEILAGRCRHAKITVRQEYPDMEPQAMVDANQVRQAMMNLMVNAIEAMPGGGAMTLTISDKSACVRFSVADTGKGVSGGDGDKNIFDAFVSGKPNGVGLGLYLCKEIVTRHGGRIGYDNADTGAVFWFELPGREHVRA